jgi:peroxiredoxin
MTAIALKDDSVFRWSRLPISAILGTAALTVLTVFLTWRAYLLETDLQRQSRQPFLVDRQAPDFSASTLDGRTVSLADYRGQKKVVVAFWASWCGPCRLEMPALTKFYKENHGAGSEFEILSVSIDEDIREAANFATAQQLNFPVLLDPRQKIATDYKVEGIPTMFVINKDGKITHGHVGYEMSMEYWLPRELGIRRKQPAEGEPGGSSSH